jgi:hypothetical protein
MKSAHQAYTLVYKLIAVALFLTVSSLTHATWWNPLTWFTGRTQQTQSSTPSTTKRVTHQPTLSQTSSTARIKRTSKKKALTPQEAQKREAAINKKCGTQCKVGELCCVNVIGPEEEEIFSCAKTCPAGSAPVD